MDSIKIADKEFALDTLHTVEVTTSEVSNTGKNQIRRLLRDHTGLEKSLPKEFDWQWIGEFGQLRGKFPTRVGQYYAKEVGVKLPPSLLSEIGNIAHAHLGNPSVFEIDFTQNFNWRAGDYGDSGSCFWGGRQLARKMLADNGGYAVRFYDPTTLKGYARAWILPDAMSGSAALIWNGYGFDGDSTLTIARILSSLISWDYKRIKLTNCESTIGLLYINGDGIGYMLGNLDAIEPVKHYDLRWEKSIVTCSNCGDEFEKSDTAVFKDRPLCLRCWDRYILPCHLCGDFVNRGLCESMRIILPEGRKEIAYYCDEHHNVAASCHNCGTHYAVAHLAQVKVETGSWSGPVEAEAMCCPDCINHRMKDCPDCHAVKISTSRACCRSCERRREEERQLQRANARIASAAASSSSAISLSTYMDAIGNIYFVDTSGTVIERRHIDDVRPPRTNT